MKNGFFKIAVSLILLTVMIVSTALPSFALPITSQISDNYLYSYLGEAVEAPLAYKAVKVLGAGDLGLERSFQPADLFVRDNLLYIVDKGGNQIVVIDENYQTVAVILH